MGAAKGSGLSDISWFLLVISGLAIVWWFSGGPNNPAANAGPFLRPPAPLGSGEAYYSIPSVALPQFADYGDGNAANVDANETVPPSGASPWLGKVKIGSGSAQYEFQPNHEYITLEAAYNNSEPINISGWWLKNGKDSRTYHVSGQSRPGVSDWVRIPLAVETFVGGEANAPRDPIMLAPGGRAVISTGAIAARSPYHINASFRVNLCSGYLDDLPNYIFTPNLWTQCPAPRDELNLNTLDDDCFDFVKNLAACHVPEFDEDADGNEYVDGRLLDLSRHCRAYVAEHFDYNACLRWYGQSPDFKSDEWRVFLNRSFELWEDNREIITLLDADRRVVDEYRYD